ncbi:D-glycero-alpha-D-manno-heptose-1,7-bisphosphate 7-phosphatase [Siccirubricoccus phaeus]|uniref:D-glycero-alpha-D-manno-heptose-1,7-bisphosphate 7-phosphatase n=1 Tax=Siccirubricoccus phaeus TaxID=2595053 RepID=UPI0011F235FD|nr:HAD family hydrolase [Siccirubricoccus phaeus]
MRPALFLDRDGVVNADRGYVHRIEQVEFLPGIFALARAARARDMPIVIVTNQSGIGRGLYSEADFAALMQWMAARFATEGAPLTGVEHCPDHPVHGLGSYRRENDRRKPGPGMLRDAAARHGLALGRSVMVGDHATDMLAGQRAGLPFLVLVGGDAAEAAAAPPGTLALPSVAAAAAWLEGLRPATPAGGAAPASEPGRAPLPGPRCEFGL